MLLKWIINVESDIWEIGERNEIIRKKYSIWRNI